MKRRDFLKNALLTSGLLASGLTPQLGRANEVIKGTSNTIYRRPNKRFRRIDAYCHFSPTGYLDNLESFPGAMVPNPQRKLVMGIPSMSDINDRLTVMDDCGIEVSIFTPQPSIESAGSGVYANPVNALAAAQYINNRMGEVVATHQDRFKSVAMLPTNLPSTPENVTIMLDEFERAVGQGAVGACFFVSPTHKPPDHSDYMQLYAKAVDLGVPLWMHPTRGMVPADYTQDVPPLSKYYLFLLLDWLLDSSVAMARIVFSGVFDTYPDLKLICHHHGALIPFFGQNRLDNALLEEVGIDAGIPPTTSKPYIDQFRKFYVDSVASSDLAAETDIIKIVVDFFGPDHVLFGTDASFATDNGRTVALESLYAIEKAIKLNYRDKKKIFSENIMKIIPQA